MKSLIATSITAYSLFFAALPADAGAISVDVKFSTREAQIIREYYDHNPVSRNNGKNKAKSLPPGIAKNLARGKALPPGIAKQALPAGLINILPATPHGFERVVLDGKVLLVEIATQIIHDVLTDAILK